MGSTARLSAVRFGNIVACVLAWAMLPGGCPPSTALNGDQGDGQVAGNQFWNGDDPATGDPNDPNSGLSSGGGGLLDGVSSGPLQVTPTLLDYGTSKATLSFEIRNTGAATLNYSVASTVAWAKPSATAGACAKEIDKISVTVERTGLPAGANVGYVEVRAGRQAIRVQLNVSSLALTTRGTQPTLNATPTALDFGTTATRRQFLVRNLGPGVIAYSIASNKSWATATPAGGTVDSKSATITVDLNRAAMDPNDTQATLTVSGDDGQSVEVALNAGGVAAGGPILEVSAQVLDFGPDATELAFTIQNAGTGTLEYALAPADGWVRVNPTSGVSTGPANTITVTVDRGALDIGTWNSSIGVTSNGGTAQLAVTLQVVDPDAGTQNMSVLQALQALPPMPKRHVYDPIQGRYWPVRDPAAVEIVRLTRCAAVNGEQVFQIYIEQAADICWGLNQQHPGLDAQVTLTYLAYHPLRYPSNSPPTDTTHDANEVALFVQRTTQIRDYLNAWNARNGANIRISHMYFGSERWATKPPTYPGYQEWNAAVDAKHNLFYDASKAVLPNTEVLQYSRGGFEGWGYSWMNGEWHMGNYYSTNERGDCYSVMLYQTVVIEKMRGAFRATYNYGLTRGVTKIVPWVALASGFDHPDNPVYISDWRYDPFYSWQIGAEINQPQYGANPSQYAPYNAAHMVVLYPPPWDNLTPMWIQHFIAYARGATGQSMGYLPSN